MYICGNIINNNDERTHFFRKYTSHTLFERVAKGLCVRGVLETEQTTTYWPQVPLAIAALLLFLLACSIGGPEGSSPLLGAGSPYLELQLKLQLTDSNCGTGLYNCLTSTCFLCASHLHRIQPLDGQGYILISSTGCTCFSIEGWVEGLYVTLYCQKNLQWQVLPVVEWLSS